MNKKGFTFMISTIMIIIIIILVVVILLFLLHESSKEREESLDIVFSGTETQTILTTFLRTPLDLPDPEDFDKLGLPPDEATHADLIRKYINEDNAEIYRLLETQIATYFSENRHPNKWQITILYYDETYTYWFKPEQKNQFFVSGYTPTNYCSSGRTRNYEGAFDSINCAMHLMPKSHATRSNAVEKTREDNYKSIFRRGNIAFKYSKAGLFNSLRMMDSYEYDSEPDLIISQAYQVLPNYDLTHKPSIVVVLHREEFKR